MRPFYVTNRSLQLPSKLQDINTNDAQLHISKYTKLDRDSRLVDMFFDTKFISSNSIEKLLQVAAIVHTVE
jgi:hypothetical protein